MHLLFFLTKLSQIFKMAFIVSDFKEFLLHTLGVISHLKIQNKLCQLACFKV